MGVSGGSGACLGASNKELQPAHEIMVPMRVGEDQESLEAYDMVGAGWC